MPPAVGQKDSPAGSARREAQVFADGIGDDPLIPLGDLIGNDDGIDTGNDRIELGDHLSILVGGSGRAVLDVEPVQLAGRAGRPATASASCTSASSGRSGQ